MKCKVLKSFPLSTDGINSERVEKGQTADVPKELVDGLVDEGFIEKPSRGKKPETKVTGTDEKKVEGTDETKKDDPDAELTQLREQYKEVSGEDADDAWTVDELKAKIIEA